MEIVYNAGFGGWDATDEFWDYVKAKCLEQGIVVYRSPMDEEVEGALPIGRIPQHHPILVEAVKHFKEVNPSAIGRLSIFETKANRYYITEYDGYEEVHTPEEEDKDWIYENDLNGFVSTYQEVKFEDD